MGLGGINTVLVWVGNHFGNSLVSIGVDELCTGELGVELLHHGKQARIEKPYVAIHFLTALPVLAHSESELEGDAPQWAERGYHHLPCTHVVNFL